MRMAVAHMGADGVIAEALWEAEVQRFTASQKGTHITKKNQNQNQNVLTCTSGAVTTTSTRPHPSPNAAHDEIQARKNNVAFLS